MRFWFRISPVIAAALLFPLARGQDENTEVKVGILPDEISPGVPRAEMVTAFLEKKAFAALDQRDAEYEKLKTPEELKRWQDERRAFFLRQLGGFPEGDAPLNAKVTGTLTPDTDYRIEKIVFESQPGFHVTGVLYLPKGKGPFPVVLHPTGHSASAKNRELYQQASIVIAKGGCAVFCYDPIGQGERAQVFNPDSGAPYATTVQHTMINQGMHLLGSNTARTMIWDGMRAIDYLQSRPDIDGDKIGCTGISGGGTNTSYLMSLDDRIVAAAPGCYLTGFRSLLKTIGPQDAEQNIHGQIAFGLDHSDYVLMRLPKPTLIMAATEDYFDIGGAWRLFRDGKRFATRQGFPERVDLVEPDDKHGFPMGMRVAAANWMRRWLLDSDEPIGLEPELKPLPEIDLNVTENGSVLDLHGARTNFELNIEWNQKFAAARIENAKPENREKLLRRIRELIGARDLADLPEPKIQNVSERGFVIESEPGILLPAVRTGHADGNIMIYLEADPAGKGEGVSVALRGLGETTKEAGNRSFDEFFGTDWKDTMLASLVGKSHVGMRTEDIWQIVRSLRKESGNVNLKPDIVASGLAAVPALHAVALEPDLFGSVAITPGVDSWTEVLETPAIRNQQANLVFGALREYDLPILREIIATNP